MANIVVSDNDLRMSIVIKIDLASKADVGSSNNNIGFFRSIVVANSILCFSPPDISLIFAFNKFSFNPNFLK